MSALRRRLFLGVLTSCHTPAICGLISVMPFTMKLETERTMRSCFAIALDTQMKNGGVKAKCFRGQFGENES